MRISIRHLSAAVVCLLPIALLPPRAEAQSSDVPPGVRAQGMAGAFVGVADDASAPFWNPAGLPQMGLATGMLTWSTGEREPDPGEPLAAGPNAWSHDNVALTVGLPAIAFSYARTQTAGASVVATAEQGPDRQDPRTAAVARRLDTSQFGISIAQAIGDVVVVGSTLRLLHGGAGADLLPSSLDAAAGLDRAEGLATTDRTRFDADVGLLAYAGYARVGVSFRHLAEPTFLDAAGDLPALRLERGVRAGVAFGTGRMWNQQPWTIAIDADLTTLDAPDGERRAIAIGAERWWGGRRIGLRGGGQWQTVGSSRGLATVGASLALRAGLYVDAYGAAGSDLTGRGWGIAARFAY